MPERQSDLPKLARPAQRALASAGIEKLADLGQFTESEVADLHGMGPNALVYLKAAMAETGVAFKS